MLADAEYSTTFYLKTEVNHCGRTYLNQSDHTTFQTIVFGEIMPLSAGTQINAKGNHFQTKPVRIFYHYNISSFKPPSIVRWNVSLMKQKLNYQLFSEYQQMHLHVYNICLKKSNCTVAQKTAPMFAHLPMIALVENADIIQSSEIFVQYIT